MKKTFNSILLIISVLFMSSCLKSTDLVGPEAPGSIGAVIEFANPGPIATSTGTLTVPVSRYDFTGLATGDKVHVDVNYAGTGKAAPSAVTVNLTTDANAVASHYGPSQLNRAYTLLPAALYTLPASVTIPSGQTKAGFDFVISNAYELNKTYSIGLKIASASTGTVSGNFGTIILTFNRTK